MAVRFSDPPLWRLIVTDLTSATLTILDERASERAIVYTLGQAASTTGLVASDDPEINIPAPDPTSPAFVSNNTRLIYGLRREMRQSPGDDPYQPRYGGLIQSMEDVAADTPTSRYTAYDPWQYLMSRPVRWPDTLALPNQNGVFFDDARASDMALDLLVATVTVDGPVFIDFGTDSIIEETDIITGRTTFAQGLSVGEAWQQLCATGTIDIRLPPIYDPVNRPGMLTELQIAPKLGEIRYNAVFAWDKPGKNVTELSRMVDGTRLANRVQGFTGQGGPAIPLQSDAASIATYGEYWSQQSVSANATNAALVELLMLAQVQIRRNGVRSIQFAPAPERSLLALRDYGIGDYVPLWSSRNLREPLGIDYDAFNADAPGASGYQRIFVLPIELDDNGVERVRSMATSQDVGGIEA